VIEKPHRFLLDRVTSYGEEGRAYLRRRKIRGRPFARVWYEGGEEVAMEGDAEQRLTAVAGALIEGSRSS
jgi:hypothetical protein